MDQPPSSFTFIFFVFSNKQYNFCNKSMWKNVMSILFSNPRPLDHESPPVSTRPGLPLHGSNFFIAWATVLAVDWPWYGAPLKWTFYCTKTNKLFPQARFLLLTLNRCHQWYGLCYRKNHRVQITLIFAYYVVALYIWCITFLWSRYRYKI